MQDILNTIYQQFSQTTAIEWVATISGFLCVYLAAKQNILNWPISIISVSLYMYIFYHSKLYGDSILQLYFLGTAVYGWIYWSKKEHSDERPINSLTTTQWIITLSTILLTSLLIGYILDRSTNTDVPYIDGFCTATSLVAQFLMTRKVLENWLIWIFVDICYIPLYIHKNLVLTAILYFAFAIIAFNGYREWLKTYRNFQ